jgi:hypothetical protein
LRHPAAVMVARLHAYGKTAGMSAASAKATVASRLLYPMSLVGQLFAYLLAGWLWRRSRGRLVGYGG